VPRRKWDDWAWLKKVHIVCGDEGINEYEYVGGCLTRNGTVIEWVQLDLRASSLVEYDHDTIVEMSYEESLLEIRKYWGESYATDENMLELIPISMHRVHLAVPVE
jgi:hypothetical protein